MEAICVRPSDPLPQVNACQPRRGSVIQPGVAEGCGALPRETARGKVFQPGKGCGVANSSTAISDYFRGRILSHTLHDEMPLIEAKKRRRAGALPDTDARQRAPDAPPGFGVRQPSGALGVQNIRSRDSSQIPIPGIVKLRESSGTSGGFPMRLKPAGRCSAELHSAVSQICNLRGVTQSQRARERVTQ